MRRPLLVGEANPYGTAPAYALYPWPRHASGDRLRGKILGLEDRVYLARFERVNLCPQSWSAGVARARAAELFPGRSVVLLGRKVAETFAGWSGLHPDDVPPFGRGGVVVEGRVVSWTALPHPSGRCREWADLDRVHLARSLVDQAIRDSARCDDCGAAARHAEHFHEQIRAWCDDCVPMSGHYEHCPCDALRSLLGWPLRGRS